jgi:hypothetical protein
MQFFRYFPTIPYTFVNADGTFTVFTTSQITAHVKILQALQQNLTVFYDYIIADGQRPDSVAQAVYGSVNYTWVILLINNIFTLFDWPLTQDEFSNYITEAYGSLAAAQAISIYSTVSGVRVDDITYGLLPGPQQGAIMTAYDNELALNEAKRRIKVIPAAFVAGLVSNLKDALAS